MEKLDILTSEDIVANNIAKLQEIFPTAFSEGKLVVEELQALLGEYIEKEQEYYQMTWAGKAQAQQEANKVSTGTLRPSKAESKDWDSTGNILIEGDNLEVLKLLQKTYSNKIKMIYIDPPYNTGNDFVYDDDFADNLNNYLELTGLLDKGGKKLSTNTYSDGRFHSRWLNNMYMRLKLTRNLLADDGVIFISIDDNEQANLKKLCDEIFGEENFVGQFIWRKKEGGGQATEHFVIEHEYIIVYKKSELLIWNDRITKRDISEFNKVDENGNFKITKLAKWGNTARREDRPSMYFPLYAPDETVIFPIAPDGNDGRWRVGKSRMQEIVEQGLLFWEKKKGKWVAYEKEYYRDQNKILKQRSILYTVANTGDGANALTELFARKDVFENPKPIELLKEIFYVGGGKNAIILDFFAGSGTTAHAVMALNANDGGNRKCISVQLPEPTDEKSEAYKAGYKTIAAITKERIRRAGELVKKENQDKEGIDKLDVGFRVFKLDSSNIRAWDTAVDKLQEQLDLFDANDGDHIKPDRTEEDVLFEILLKYGLELTQPIQERTIGDGKLYNIGFGTMYICLAQHIRPEIAKTIGDWHQEFEGAEPSVIFRDAGFANDQDKTNTVQTLRQFGIENVKSI